jgi:sarcosine oxidase
MKVVVVGGGVMGAAAAWRLAVRGAEVVVLEQFGPGHARGASHGSARIFRLAYAETEYVRFAEHAYDLWRDLERSTGSEVLALTGAVDHGYPAQLDALHHALTEVGAAAAVMAADEAARRFPGLRFEGDVLWHERAGRLHADRAVEALKAAVVAQGGEVRHDVEVVTVDSGDGATVVTAGGEQLVAEAVVVAAGGWSRRLLGDLVPLPQLRVTIEQPANFRPLERSMAWPSFIHHPGAAFAGPGGAAVYGLGSVDGVKVGFHKVGPEIDPAEAERPIDGERLAVLQDYVRAWIPGVDPDSAAPQPCTYTLTPDEHFVVDRQGPLTVLAGFSGHGFKFAPAIGELAARLTLDGATPPPTFALGPRPLDSPHPPIR